MRTRRPHAAVLLEALVDSGSFDHNDSHWLKLRARRFYVSQCIPECIERRFQAAIVGGAPAGHPVAAAVIDVDGTIFNQMVDGWPFLKGDNHEIQAPLASKQN